MGLLDLFVAASMPVLKVLLVTGLGLILALDRIDLLGDDARKHLNNIVFFVFSPALVSSNLAKTITYESMKKLWFMPFNILITFIIGSILGWAVLQITRPSQHLRGLVVGCCAAGNLGNMLLIIIPAVCKEKGSPFGDPGICHTYGMGYASLSMAVGAIYLWSYVYNIVRISSSKSTKEVEINDPPASRSSREGSISQLGTSTESLLPSKVPPEQLGLPSTRFDHKTQAHLGTKLKQYMENLSKKINLKTLLAPSTTGAIAGFIVGLVPQIRKLMIGDVAPLRVIENSAILLGDGAIPLLTLIMGGNLLKGLTGSGIQKSLLVGIIVVRYIILPLIGIVAVKGAIRLGLVQHDPLYQFVLLLQFALPPAMNIGTITQLFGAGESECSVIMLWAYALASISLTLWTTFFMWLVA
ncbi:putative psbP domain-containing protein 3, chloroplastic-like [Capsicum annuum]|uniref:protein PIN-LIKES 3 isoform X2 n=1 Tax=Capsicum annuum TaxID=4072 RepID=UPI0007BF4E86|nr:protein PIN-LIKES 3 isoform X2 [Capsicum annuum]XP_047267362.1 protein PIN-LIKES 3 isoform X2 [Capsicum annuum]XP_047267363.1 protein PIN-LIKES 3 isoform X2 [Capsicum annuum]KAF3619811.1 putative psbP domain-containing protein 3, chloroplastic-like [Capsicum annuum]